MGILSLAKRGTGSLVKLGLPSILPYALGGAFLLGALPAGYAGWKLRDIGYQRRLKADLKASLAATTKARQTEATGAVITDKVRQTLDTAKATQAATTKTIIERVPYYVHDPRSDQACPSVGGCGNLGTGQGNGGSVAGASVDGQGGSAGVPAGWSLSDGFVRLHNYAATGTNPPLSEPPSFDPDAPSGVGMPALAGVLTRNYGVCYGYRAEVTAWRQWYAEQAALWAAQAQGKSK